MTTRFDHALDALEKLFEGATNQVRPMEKKEAETARLLVRRFIVRAAEQVRLTPEERRELASRTQEAA
jgi:hypothetical protein